MSLTLNTSHPLAGNLIALICVDDGVIKDLATPARSFTAHANVQYGSGLYGNHFTTRKGGSYSPYGVSFSPSIDVDVAGAGVARTVLIVVNNVNDVSAAGYMLVAQDRSNRTFSPIVGTSGTRLRYRDTSSASAPGYVMGGGPKMITGVRSEETSHALYLDGTQVVSGGQLSSGNAAWVNYIGGDPGAGVCAAEFVWIAYFDKALSPTEISGLFSSLGASNAFALATGDTNNTPPTGAVTIITVTPSATSVVVTYSYNTTDQTGFQYRLDGGPPASLGTSPATISGLTASTEYSLEIRAVNASGSGAWSSVRTFTTDAAAPGNSTPLFNGPAIGPVPAAVGVGVSLSVSGLFSDPDGDSLTYSPIGTFPPGVTVGSTGVISGTPTTQGTHSGLKVRATDPGGLFVESNVFTITVAAPPPASTLTVPDPLKNNTGTVLSNLSGVRVAVLRAADLVSIFDDTGLTTNASGKLAPITDPSITSGQTYHVVIKTADGGVGITGPIIAS